MSIRIRSAFLASLLALVSFTGCNRAAAPQWTTTEGIEAPESVYLDPESGFMFSSQVGGPPDGHDGNGRIVKLTGSGAVVSSTWVTGLNGPKGLRGCNGTLWTADIDEVVGIEIASGKITSRVKVPDAKMLNDIVCGSDGTVFVTDTVASKIIALKDGTPSVFAEGEQLEWPNGLLADGDRLIVGGWGKPDANFATTVPGRLYALDLKTKEKTLITPTPFANIDGIESDGHGGFIITDFMAGKIMHVNDKGEMKDLGKFAVGTADLAFIADTHIAIVPHMNENKLAAYDLSEALR